MKHATNASVARPSSLLSDARSGGSAGANRVWSMPFGIGWILARGTPHATSSEAIGEEIATYASARARSARRSAQTGPRSPESGARPARARPARKYAPESSPWLSALNTHGIPDAAATSRDGSPRMR